MAQFEPLKELEAIGLKPDQVSEEQRQVLSSLTPEEVKVLVNTKKRLDDASDVKGYADTNNGGVIF